MKVNLTDELTNLCCEMLKLLILNIMSLKKRIIFDVFEKSINF